MTEMVEKLRNIVLIAHGGAGKTSLAEVMLYDAGVINRLGRVDDGNAAMDYEPEELKRNISISTAFHQFPWKKHTINIIDTPGDQNFFSDTRTCMQAADSVIVLVDAVDGVKVQTEQGWDFAEEFGLPRMIFINKLDRERADFFRAFNDAAEIFEPKPIIIQLPIGKEDNFNGIVDLLSMKAYTYDENGKAKTTEIPSDMAEQVESERENLIENVAEADDELLERYLEGESLSDDEIMMALKKGIRKKVIVPVLCGSATKNIGINLLQDFIVQCLPSPEDRGLWKATAVGGEKEIEIAPDPNAPFSAFIFKTVADPYAGRLSIFRIVSGTLGSDGTFFNTNKDTRERFSQLLRITGKEQKTVEGAIPGDIVAVSKLKESTTGDTLSDEKNKVMFKLADPMPSLISFALVPKSKGDEDKVFTSLQKLLEEDTALKVDRNSETKEILISGLGNIHIEVTVEKLKRKFNVEVELNVPKVPYRETVRKKVRVQGKHKKQTGGHGQYGDCWIQLEPLPRGQGFEFVDAIVGGVIPKGYIPAVEKGIVESSRKGVLAGFPCIDFRATVDDGSYHAVDSSEMAFKVAGSLAFKKAATQAEPVLLEPIMAVNITIPDEYMGDVMGDLNGRRGRVLGMDNKGKNQIINAQVPMSEMLSYALDLRSMTGGRGIFSMEFSHYDEVPVQVAQKIIEAANKAKE
jgi:elongation factor G